MIYYSPSTGGFYNPDIHSDIPQDAVEISNEQHADLLDQQSQGKSIIFKDGQVVAEMVIPEVTWDTIRSRRSPLLKNSDWTQMADSPLTSSAKADWAASSQTLRALTETHTSPNDENGSASRRE